MSPRDLASISVRALAAQRLRTRFTMAAVAVGVASVLILTSLGHSATLYVLNQFSGIGSNLLIVIPGKVETSGGPPMMPGTTKDLTLEDAETLLRQLPRVTGMAPVSVGLTMARVEGRARSVTVIGSTPEFVPIRALRVSAGQNLPDEDPRRGSQVCLIGAKIRRELFGNENPLGRVMRLGDHRFRVIGLIATEGQSLGVDVDEMVLVPVSTVMRMVNREGLFRIILQVRSVDEIEAAREDVRAMLVDRHEKEDFTLITQQAVVESLEQILGMLTLAVAAIGAISLGVAGVGIMNVMLISVAERTGEIGLIKAVGASNAQVMAVFLAEAAMVSLLGGAFGVAAGLALSQFVEVLLPAFPMSTPLWAVEASLGVAVGIGVLFGVLPAAKAARMTPVEALRARM